MKKLGKVQTVEDISDEYLKLATNDERVAVQLAAATEYRHAMYFTIQAMEKQIRATIFTIINPNLKTMRDLNAHHSLKNAIDLLIDVASTDPLVKEMLRNQLQSIVLRDIHFAQVHNNLRYPYYSNYKDAYQAVIYSKQDYDCVYNALQQLKVYLRDLGVKRL